MSLLPTDMISFLWGSVAGGLMIFSSGFLKKAGEHAFSYLTKRLNPLQPEPVQVDGQFTPSQFAPHQCSWVNAVGVYDYEAKGFIYYPHPKTGGKCFRVIADGSQPLKQFLVVQPGAQRVASA